MNEVLFDKEVSNGKRLKIVLGDITEEPVDAIVNAANSYLRHGGGVAGAIVRKGGAVIQEESDRIGFVPTGGAAVTGAGKLPCRFVIHAVGPVWEGGAQREEDILRSAVESALRCASDLKIASLSIPAISSGIFGFPKEKCAEIILKTVERFFTENPNSSITETRLCNIDRETTEIFVNKAT